MSKRGKCGKWHSRVFFGSVHVQPTTSINCAKENNKENVVGSKTPCKGEKLSRVNERMARAAGVNVGECLCIAHPDEAVRVNNRCEGRKVEGRWGLQFSEEKKGS